MKKYFHGSKDNQQIEITSSCGYYDGTFLIEVPSQRRIKIIITFFVGVLLGLVF